MLQAKRLVLRDKQAFDDGEGTLRLLGQAIDVAKRWKKEGIELLHIVDLDAQKGSEANFDVYDKLTYLMHVQVECGSQMKFIGRLLKIGARVVVALPLPTNISLRDFAEKKNLLVGKINADFEGDLEEVHDVLVEDATLESVKRFQGMGRRVLVWKKDFVPAMKKHVFGVMEP